MARRKLPIGIQTFRKIREASCYYVDKTPYITRLVEEGTHYFLSRPRRFGKSLFIDTLKELFDGSESLFRGLSVHAGWDWSQRHPVVRLDFSGGNFRRPGRLEEHATAQIEDIGRRAGVGAGESGSAPVRLRRLIEALHERTGRRAAILVDEYDKPILDALDTPDMAKANRDDLRGLYGTIKASEAHVEFTFITGVSYEGYYASVFYSHFAALGLDVVVEDSSSRGRLDMTVRCAGRVYLFEFKVVEQASTGAALAQLKARGYADKHRGAGPPLRLIGVEFSRSARNIVAFESGTRPGCGN